MRKKPVDSKELKVRVNQSGDAEMVYSDDEEVLNDDVLPAMMPEMQQYQRAAVSPQHTVSMSDVLRVNDDTLTNMTGSEPLAAPGPEDEMAESNLEATIFGSDPRDKTILGNDRTGLDTGVTHNESVTARNAVTAPPGFGTQRRRNNMAQKKAINEWSPEFIAGEYKPGEPKMDHLGGDEIQSRTSTELKVGKKPTDMTAHSDPFGAKLKDNIAMAIANDMGVVEGPQASHKSTHGEPTSDDCCDEVGHNWPDEPKNKGGSVGEPVEGHSYGTAAIKGGKVAAEWTVNNFAKMIGEDADLQNLFDNYAKTVPHVCVEDFQTIINANGVNVMIDDVGLNTLMAKNTDFVFYANEDANGPYYTPISEMTDTAGVGFADSTSAEPENDEDAFLKKFVDKQKTNQVGLDESVKSFLKDAKTIKEAAQLNKLWDSKVGAIKLDSLSKALEESLVKLQTRVPGFQPLVESDAMDSPKGTGLKGGDGPKVELKGESTDMKELDSKNDLIKRKPVNNLDKTPTIPGTGKGMTAESLVRKNIEKIVGRVASKLSESKLPKYDDVTYYVTLSEGKRGKARKSVAEAAADAEEALQLFEPRAVGIQAVFSNAAGSILMKKDIPLFTIDSRGAFVTEGKTLFRHKVFAEGYADSLYKKGYATKLVPHNWGFAVTSNAPSSILENWAPEGLAAPAAPAPAAPQAPVTPASEEEDKAGFECGYMAPEECAVAMGDDDQPGYAANDELPEEVHVDIFSHDEDEGCESL